MGFPPKDVSASQESATLESLGIKNGEQLIVSLGSKGLPALNTYTAPLSSEQKVTVAPVSKSLNTNSKFPSVSLDDGILQVREMKDDNSCLFRSIGYLFERNAESATSLRKVIVEAIKNNPFEYSEAILGKDVEDYCRWIQTPQAWGGAIELAIFSEHYKTEIDSIDISTCRVDRFGEGKYGNRALVLYSGIHYDAVALNPMLDGPSDFDMTTFPINSEGEKYLLAGIKLAEELKKAKKFTDLANFTLKCGICKKGLKGQKEAQAHALETGHAEFTEYS